MKESFSTLGAPVRWADEIATNLNETRDPFFVHEDARDFFVKVREDAESSDSESADLADFESRLGSTPPPSHQFRVPRVQRLRLGDDPRYILLKKYEGFVTSRTKDTFSARLLENNSDYPVLEAEFDLEELSEDDRALAIEGAPLVWTIGYSYDGGTRIKESIIYLRRLPAWSQEEIAKAEKSIKDLTSGISWE